MARTAGRSAEDTRQLILTAAARVIGAHGTAAPLSDIAQAAGVSKGGLLYHFPTKETLVHGVAAGLIDQFHTAVRKAAAQEPEGTVGRLTRAYARVSFDLARDVSGLRDYIALASQLMHEPGVEELAQADAGRWRAALHQDGLDPAIVRLVIAAADGINSTPLWGAILTDADLQALEAELVSLTTRATPSG